MLTIYFKDGTSFVFSLDSYVEIYQHDRYRRGFKRLFRTKHSPTSIYIDMYGRATFYLFDGMVDVKQITAFNDGKEIFNFA